MNTTAAMEKLRQAQSEMGFGNLLGDALGSALEGARLRRRLPPPATRRLIRKRAGLSQVAVARALGVDRATISRWESGERDPEEAHLVPYIEALDRLAREVMR